MHEEQFWFNIYILVHNDEFILLFPQSYRSLRVSPTVKYVKQNLLCFDLDL